jgi:outer membrane receptor protein involved in Fe transport
MTKRGAADQTTRAAGALAILAVAAFDLFGSDAQAQEGTGAANKPQPAAPQAAAPGGAGTDLEEVKVTAERRESTVLKTPISITAVSGAELEARGETSLLSVAEETPGVGFRTAGPGQTEFDMRGLSSAGGFSPTVGFYLDDVPLTAPVQAQNGKVVIDPDLYDLTRLEVLRGPQGTLYGAGSMGGTIRLISNQPDPKVFSASTSAGVSDTDGGGVNYDTNFMVNIPLVDDVAAVRVVGTDRWMSGWIDRVVLNDFPLETNGFSQRGNVLAAPIQRVNSDVNGSHLVAGRVELLLKLDDRLTVTPTVLYQRISAGGPDTIDNPPGDRDAHYQPFDVAELFKDEFSLASIDIKYKFDAVSVTSVTSYWRREQRQTQDISEDLQELLDFPAFYVDQGGLGPQSIVETDRTSQVSEELRLASEQEGPLHWLLGGFYSNFQSNTQFYSASDVFIPIFGTSATSIINQPIGMRENAVFGEVSYNFTRALKATVGLRWYDYTNNETTYNLGWGTIAGGGTTVVESSGASSSATTPKVTVSYAADDYMAYATASKGFRPGAGNQPIPLSGPVQCLTGPGNLEDRGFGNGIPSQFKPDTVWSYELGEKARLWDGGTGVNSSIYYERWNNVQQQIDPSCGYYFTDNVGDATIKGAEVELAQKVTGHLSATANYGYTHAVFTSVLPGTGVSAGDRMLYVPQSTASVALLYTQPLTAENTLTGRVSYSYVGSRDDLTYGRNTLPAYSLVNARLGIENYAWSAALYCDNLTDRRVLLSDTTGVAVNIETLNRVTINQPRTVGITFSYRR